MIEISIVDYLKNKIYKIISYVYLTISCLGIIAMTGGPWSGNSLYSQYNVKVWIYVLTSLIILILLTLSLNIIFSNIPIKGKIVFQNDKIKVVRNGKKDLIFDKDLVQIKFKMNYLKYDGESTFKPITIVIITDSLIFKSDAFLTEDIKNELMGFLCERKFNYSGF